MPAKQQTINFDAHEPCERQQSGIRKPLSELNIIFHNHS